jgi:hypothetical protein
MSLLKDITEIKSLLEAGPIFKPASPENLKHREELDPELRREREEKEKRERMEAQRRAYEQEGNAKIKQVITAMGYKPYQRSGWNQVEALDKSDKKVLSLRLIQDYNRADAGRIKVSGDYPRDRQASYVGDVYDENNNKLEQPTINVSASKSVEQIVKDIQRRFMPYYEQFYAAALKKAKATDSYEDKTSNALTLIAGRKLSEYEARHKEISISAPCAIEDGYDANGHIKASGDSIEFSIHGISAAQAKQMLKILNAKVGR